MKILHFYPPSSQIRFLRRFQEHLKRGYSGSYVCFDRSAAFLNELEARVNHTDIILITAHGDTCHIIGEKLSGTHILLSIDKFQNTKNSFVFAFACRTSPLGEQMCSVHKAISYLGFDDYIKLTVGSTQQAYRDELESLLKSIYNQALSISFDQFVNRSWDVSEFAQAIAINLKLCFAQILALPANELSVRYSLSYARVSDERFLMALHADLLTTLDDLGEHIVVHGEKAFIPWQFIRLDDKEFLRHLIQKIESAQFRRENQYYQDFLLGYLYLNLDALTVAVTYLLRAKRGNTSYKAIDTLIGAHPEVAELMATGT